MRSAAPVVVDHADHHPLYADWADRATVPQSIAGVPLMRAGRALGVFTTAFFDRQTIASQDQQLLTMLADQAAVAVDNAQLHATALRRVREFESLRQVELALASNLNLHQLLQTIVAQVIALVDAQGAGLYIYLPELDQLELRVSQQPASWPGDFSGTRLQRHEGLAGAVLASNQIIMTNDYHANFSSTPFADVPVSSVLGVPLTWGSEFLGVLTIFNTDTGRAFNLDDQRVVSLLSGQVAVAIVNARLYEDARLRAEKLAVAYAELKQLDRLKDEFVQTVSHELRTPLTFVCGYVDLLLEDVMGTLNPQQREALSIVSDRAAATVRLVNDIISMQQAEMEPRQPQPVDLADLVQTCGESARMTALSHGIEMGVMVAPNLPPVLGDADRYQVQSQWRRHPGDGRAGAGPPGRQRRRAGGHQGHHPGPGHRHRGRPADAHLGAVLPGGQHQDAALWRHRPGAGHCQADRGRAWRGGGGRESIGRREFILVHRACLPASGLSTLSPARPTRPAQSPAARGPRCRRAR